jgi:hypothetical protein
MTEEAFLRYRMAVVERMPDSPCKRALIVAIQSRMKVLRMGLPVGLGTNTGGAQLPPNGPRPAHP